MMQSYFRMEFSSKVFLAQLKQLTVNHQILTISRFEIISIICCSTDRWEPIRSTKLIFSIFMQFENSRKSFVFEYAHSCEMIATLFRWNSAKLLVLKNHISFTWMYFDCHLQDKIMANHHRLANDLRSTNSHTNRPRKIIISQFIFPNKHTHPPKFLWLFTFDTHTRPKTRIHINTRVHKTYTHSHKYNDSVFCHRVYFCIHALNNKRSIQADTQKVSLLSAQTMVANQRNFIHTEKGREGAGGWLVGGQLR